ncbi:MAG: hemolysin III family protein [Chthoniobacterales bacterium]|nr:hemolysin III family protein [Chthoniobacterales bacterium]
MDVVEQVRREIRWNQSLGEEVANSVSHGIGLLAGAIGTPVLLFAAWKQGSVAFGIGAAVFAATMLLLYLGSTLYHAWPRSAFKGALQVLDHSAIFLLIAGTYTPFTLGPLHGPRGWIILGSIWTLAICGVILKTRKGALHRPRLAISLYLGMGWLIIVAIRPLASAVPTSTMAWLVAGGVAYTGGVVFFMREHIRYNHFIWHLFVLGGTLCHYLAVFTYATGTVA